MHRRSDKQRSAAARTYICEKGLCEDSLPAAYTPFMLGFRPTWRSLFIGINRFEASAEENVPYSKINVRPRSSSDVKNNPKQTQRSNMGS